MNNVQSKQSNYNNNTLAQPYSESALSTTTTSSIFSKDMNEYDMRMKEVESYYLSNLLNEEYIDSFKQLDSNLKSYGTYNKSNGNNSLYGNSAFAIPQTTFQQNPLYQNYNNNGTTTLNNFNKGNLYSSIPFVNVEYQREAMYASNAYTNTNTNTNTSIGTQDTRVGDSAYSYNRNYSGSVTPHKNSTSGSSQSSPSPPSSFSSPLQSMDFQNIDSEVVLAQQHLKEATERLKMLELQKNNNIHDHKHSSTTSKQQHQQPSNSKELVNPQRNMEIRKVNKALYKTELCESFVTTGKCKYLNKCQFAHGLHELKLKDVNGNYRTKHCSSWSKYGYCKYGNRCLFKHGDDADIKVYVSAGTIISDVSESQKKSKQDSQMTQAKHHAHCEYVNLNKLKKLNENW